MSDDAGDRFELLEQLGKGGMGVVWRARDRVTGEVVALKLLHSMYAGDPDYVARFERELEVVRRIHSPYVIRIFGYGRQGGLPYLSMEYIPGGSLRDLVVRRGRLGWDEASALIGNVLEGLVAAHAAGVVHRDIKPSNILVSPVGTARIADFGIARAADLTQLTGSQMTLGTPAYTAPDAVVDHRSDLYSVGCVLFELLSGAPVFEGRTQHEVLVQHLSRTPDFGRVPAESQPVLRWLLEKDPAARPQTARQALRALHGVERTPASVAGDTAQLPPKPGSARKRWIPALAVGAVALFASATGAGFLLTRESGGSSDLSFVPEIRQVAQAAPGTNGVSMWVGPWVYGNGQLMVSYEVAVSCAADNPSGIIWKADLGLENAVIAFEDGAQRGLLGGWGLSTSTAVLSCDQRYIGTWVFDAAGGKPKSLAYAGPDFVLTVPSAGRGVPTAHRTLPLADAYRVGDEVRAQGSCVLTSSAPSPGAEPGPCIPAGAVARVIGGPVDNLLRWWKVTWYDAEAWIEQEAAQAATSRP